MCLVNYEQELLARILCEPGTRRIENRAFQRTHQHVLEHRVVRYENVRRRAQDLMSGKQFGVLRLKNRTKEISVRVLPPTSLNTKLFLEIVLCGPLALRMQSVDK